MITQEGDFSVLQGKRDYKCACGQAIELGFRVREPLISECHGLFVQSYLIGSEQWLNEDALPTCFFHVL